jgi:hypothetical protein
MISNTSFKTQINWNVWAPPLLFLVFLILEKSQFGTFYSSWLYGLALILFGILYSVRYRLVQPAILFCLAGITLWHYVLAEHFDATIAMLRLIGIDVEMNVFSNPFSMLTWIINLLIFLVTIPIFGPAMAKAFKLEQFSKKIFRIAAQTVSSSKNGFTSRPFYAGNMEYSKDQFTGFAQFLASHMIVHPVFSESGTYLTFSMGKSPFAIHEPSEVSYVAVDHTGILNVHIAAWDYKRFRKELTFDRLCESMGDVFRRYLNYYLNNQEARIITELKTAK